MINDRDDARLTETGFFARSWSVQGRSRTCAGCQWHVFEVVGSDSWRGQWAVILRARIGGNGLIWGIIYQLWAGLVSLPRSIEVR